MTPIRYSYNKRYLATSLYASTSNLRHINPMDVQIQSSTIIPQQNANSNPTEMPLTIFDLYAPHIHVSVLFAFSSPTPSNSRIVDGLIKTLVHFPTLAARLGRSERNHPCVLVGGGGGGVLVKEASVDMNLEEILPLEPRSDFELLHLQWKGVKDVTLLQVQLNRFNCGGLIIGITADHIVADGCSMSTFYTAWCQSIRCSPINPLPSYNQSWLKPRTPPRLDFEHWGYEFMPRNSLPQNLNTTDPDNISNILLHYSREFIATKLKSQVKDKYSSFEILLAHVWKKITIARGLDSKTTTMAKLSVNGRPRLKPRVPIEFFGNLVLTAYPNSNVEDLIRGDLAKAARIIHEAIMDIGDEYFRSLIDFGKIYEEEDIAPVDDDYGSNVMCPNLEIDSWLGFRFNELDLGGGGELCGFMLSRVPVDGVVIFLPSLKKDGGIDVFVALLEEHAAILKEISHCLPVWTRFLPVGVEYKLKSHTTFY